MDPEGSLPHPQEPAPYPYPDPVQSSPSSHPTIGAPKLKIGKNTVKPQLYLLAMSGWIT